MSNEDKPDWIRMEQDVVRKLRLLGAAWDHTAKAMPELHEAMRRDIYLPAVKCLAAFCSTVEEKQDGSLARVRPAKRQRFQ